MERLRVTPSRRQADLRYEKLNTMRETPFLIAVPLIWTQVSYLIIYLALHNAWIALPAGLDFAIAGLRLQFGRLEVSDARRLKTLDDENRRLKKLLPVKLGVAIAVLIASQFHHWNRLSSGSIFSPEYPRVLVILFNWAIGAIVLLAAVQAVVDLGSLVSRLLPNGGWAVTDAWRYAASSAATLAAALAVGQAIRVPPLRDVEFPVRNLPPEFDGYRLLQLTDLHASRLFPASWIRAVVERSLAAGVDLIVVTATSSTATSRHAGTTSSRCVGCVPRTASGPSPATTSTFSAPRTARLISPAWGSASSPTSMWSCGEGMRRWCWPASRISRRDVGIGGTISTRPSPGAARRSGGAPRPPAASGPASRCARRGAAIVRAHARRHGPRPGPAGRPRQRGLRVGGVRRRRHDALRQQRHRPVARLCAEVGAAVRVDADHAPVRTVRSPSARRQCAHFGYSNDTVGIPKADMACSWKDNAGDGKLRADFSGEMGGANAVTPGTRLS